MTSTEKIFKTLAAQAKASRFSAETDQESWWWGFERGLRRAYHGSRYGTEEEHEKRLSLIDDPHEGRQQIGWGYRMGLRALEYGQAYLRGETLDGTQVAAQLAVTPQWVSRIAAAEDIGHKSGPGRSAPRRYLLADVERIKQVIAQRQEAKRTHAAGLASRRVK